MRTGLGSKLLLRVLEEYVVLVVVWIALREASCRAMSSERFADESFPPETTVLQQTITCGKHEPGRFVSPTYTCADLRVNGSRLAYGYYHGWAAGQHDLRCQETAGVHEFAQLCIYLLRSINKHDKGFKAVYIPNSTCTYINETRKLLKKVSADGFEWRTFKAGWGWTHTLQCMTDAVKT
ncbi:uncharacterized protein LOC106012988 [Aplysia californica]|uniref:Uncharacterized protein LOC106012988 n=1 Tax=Aplysia californica TaxID=6500 RepID=A0ABM1A8P6_APLCA|nr:uncharacterized protein LOC106012988 [Aplysia californica]